MSTSRNFVFVLTVFVIMGWSITACGNQEAGDSQSTPINSPTSQPSPINIKEPTHTPTTTTTATPTPKSANTLEPANTPTSEPTSTPTSVSTPTPTIAPTEFALSLDDSVLVEEGGFAFQPISSFLTDVYSSQAGVYSEDDEIILYMITDSANGEKSLQEMADNFIEAVSAKFDELTASDSYPYSIDGKEGLAVDVTGRQYGDDLEGKIAMVSPDETLIFTAFGFAVNDRWKTEGSEVFDAVIGSVSFTTESLAIDDDTTESNSDFPLPMPSGQPDSIWNDLPIMPQAIAGEGDDESYYFTVEASANEVQNFYENEMSKLNWSLLGVGEGKNGALLLIFQKDQEVASISIFTLDDNTMYVFLVK